MVSKINDHERKINDHFMINAHDEDQPRGR
jgi:hypothetical protein